METQTSKGTIRQGEVTQTNRTGADRRTEMLAMAKAWQYKISIKTIDIISKTLVQRNKVSLVQLFKYNT